MCLYAFATLILFVLSIIHVHIEQTLVPVWDLVQMIKH